MSVSLVYNDEHILKLSNSLFGLLHETIMEIIERENIWYSYRLHRMLIELDQNIYGAGGVFADVSEFLKTKKELLLFAYLIKETAKEKKEIFAKFGDCIKHLEEFHDKLVNYAQTLP